MFSQALIEVMDPTKLVTATTDTTVREAAGMMVNNSVGAIMVLQNERLVGIFTERDVVFRVVAKDLDVQTTRLDSVMTADPQTAHPDKSFGYGLIMMQEGGFRHLPVVEDGKLLGLVSARKAFDPELEEYQVESHRREQILRQKD